MSILKIHKIDLLLFSVEKTILIFFKMALFLKLQQRNIIFRFFIVGYTSNIYTRYIYYESLPIYRVESHFSL